MENPQLLFLFWKSDPQFSLILIGRCNLNRHLSLLQSFAKFLGRGNCDHASRNQIIMLEGGAQTNTKIRMHVYIMFNMGVQRRDGHRNCKKNVMKQCAHILHTSLHIYLIYLVCLFESPFVDLYHYKCFFVLIYIYIYIHSL